MLHPHIYISIYMYTLYIYFYLKFLSKNLWWFFPLVKLYIFKKKKPLCDGVNRRLG